MKSQDPPIELLQPIINLLNKGKLQQALTDSNAMLKQFPNSVILCNIAGASNAGLMQFDAAIESYKNALKIMPNYADAYYNMAIILNDHNDPEAAIESYKQAIKIKPDFAESYINMGIILKDKGDPEAAINSFKQALKIKPNFAEAQYNLGTTYHNVGQINNAIEYYSKAIAVKNDYPAAHNNLGQILLEFGKLDNAIKHFEWAISFKSDFSEAHNNLGAAYQQLRQFDESIKCYKKAVMINPSYAQALNNLGIVYQTLGDKNSAINYYKEAISIKEDFASAHRSLSGLKKYTKIDKQVEKMEFLLCNEKLNQAEKVYLCFALAKVYDDLGKHEELFEFLHEGNRLRKLELNFSVDKYYDNYSFFKNLFNSSVVLKSHPLIHKESSLRPIFIVGMPRSGTSLVEQIIASHPKVYGAGELDTLTQIINNLLKDNLTLSKDNLSEVFLSIRKNYIESLSKLSVSEKIITDKWPLNFQYIGFILKSFPNAKIIHLKRDNMAVCWSIYKHYFSDEGNGWAYNIDDITDFYQLYLELMDYWHKLYPDQIYDVHYENLTSDQEKETRKLLKYCELDWDKSCMNFQENKRVVMTASASQVRKKMYQGSSEDWRKYEVHLQGLLKNDESLKTNS